MAYQVDGNIITKGNKCDYLILARQDDSDNDKEMWKSVEITLLPRHMK